MGLIKQDVVIDRLRQEIRRGEHGIPGEPFMTVRGIADEFAVALATAQKVVNRLKEEGMLESRRKRLRIASRRETEKLNANCRIGLLVTNVDNPFFSRLINAVELGGRRRTIEVVTAGNDYDCAHERDQLEMLRNSGVDGFIIAPAHDELSASALNELRLPYVLIGRQVAGVDCDVVMVNHFEAGKLAAAHLIEQGCRNFLYVGLEHFHHDSRRDGFAYELSRHGFPWTPGMVVNLPTMTGDLSLEPFADLRGGRRTGIFCYHDMLAIRVLRLAKLNHLEVPGEVSIVGMDNLPVSMEVFPSLTTIGYPISQMAENAVDMLLRKIKFNLNDRPAVNYMAPYLVKRESSL